MADLEELFRTSIEREERATPSAAEAEAERGSAVALDVREPVSDDVSASGDDDLLLDVRQLVAEWNAGHTAPAEPPAAQETATEQRRRSRLAGARQTLSEHIGAQPEVTVEPPAPAAGDEDGPTGSGPPPWVRPVDAPADVEGELIPPLSRRQQRRARREIDRLERECARKPYDPTDDTAEVKLLGAAPSAPADARALDLTALDTTPRVPEARPSSAAPQWADGEQVAVREPAVVLPVEPADADLDEVDAWEDDDADAFLPDGRWARRKARKQAWKRAERQRRVDAKGQVRFPIFTRSVLTWMFVFMVAGLAFGASAAYWWSHFNSEVQEIRGETSAFTDEVANAASALETQRGLALAEIDAAMAPIERMAQPGTAPQVAAAAAPSVFFVETLDDEGAPAVGSAFVVANTEDQSLLLTSLSTVAASTTAPGPEITLRRGEERIPAELWSWDVDRDLALLVVDDPELPAMAWADDAAMADSLGSGVFVVGGIGGAGATAIPGLVVDQSAEGFQHTAVIGAAYPGGPIVTADGKVLGIASLAYQPLGFDPGDVHFAVPINQACGSVLDCGAGAPPAAGAEGGAPLPTDDEAAPNSPPEASATDD